MKHLTSSFIFLTMLFVAADFEVIITLQNPIINETISDAFRINNLDYYSGFEGEIVNINQTLNNKTTQIIKEIKKYSNSKTSNITFFNNKTQELCVNIYSQSDNNTNNNYACKTYFSNQEIEVINETSVCNPNIELMIPQVFEDKAIIDYEINNEDYEMTYWIEDLYGNIVKEKTITKNDNKKQFSPKQAGVYFFFSELNTCNKMVEKNTFFIIKKSKNNFFNAELKKDDPAKIEFTINSNEFISKGTKISYENTEIISDLLIGEQTYQFEIKDLCGEQEINIEAGDYFESFLLSLQDCKIEKNYEPELITHTEKNIIFFNMFNPDQEEIEYYIRKNNRKISNSEYDNDLWINEVFEVENEDANYEIIAQVGQKTLTKKIEIIKTEDKSENNELNTIQKPLNSPIVTGAAISTENDSFSATFVLVLLIFIFLIGDKFKKYRKSLKSNEQKRNKSRS